MTDLQRILPGLTVALGLVLLAGSFGSAYQLTVLTQAGTYAIATLGLTILVGYAGQISFGHTIFLGLGGYLSALATTRWGLGPLPGMALGVAASSVAALLVGVPTLRLRGHYLAMATFTIGLGFYAVAADTSVFNGFEGIAGIPPFSVGGLEFGDVVGKYTLVWGVALIAAVAAWRLRSGRFGRALRVLAEDEAAAAALGIDVARHKIAALVISAVFVSVAGSLQVHTTPIASPENYGFAVIIQLFVMLFIGGLGSVWGALIGAVAVVELPELLGGFQDYEPTIFGVALILILLLRPVGLFAPPAPSTRRMLRRWLRTTRRSDAPAEGPEALNA
jgi:branched-chain amino acid transport system permease protein